MECKSKCRDLIFTNNINVDESKKLKKKLKINETVTKVLTYENCAK